MQPLSAIDAIAPAFTRTHEILFHPFRLGRSWKLAVSQYFGLMGAFFIPFPIVLLFLQIPLARDPHLRALLIGFITAGMALLFAFFYLGVRLQFVNLQVIVTGQRFIAPIWRLYARRVWPVIASKIVLGTVLYLLMLPSLLRAARSCFQFAMSLPRTQLDQPPDPAFFEMLFRQFFSVYALLLLAFFIFKTFSTLFEDFALPFYTFEPISLLDALRRGAAVFAQDPLQCVLYLLLKLVLTITGFVAQYVSNIVLLIPLFIVGLIFGAVGFAVRGTLHLSGGPVHVLFAVAAVTLYLLFFALALWYQLGTYGYVFTLLESYAVYFLAGRYPHLASLLEPGPNGPFTPPPVFPSPEEHPENDDDGPTLPMNPAVA